MGSDRARVPRRTRLPRRTSEKNSCWGCHIVGRARSRGAREFHPLAVKKIRAYGEVSACAWKGGSRAGRGSPGIFGMPTSGCGCAVVSRGMYTRPLVVVLFTGCGKGVHPPGHVSWSRKGASAPTMWGNSSIVRYVHPSIHL